VDAIYHSHVLEHLSHGDARRLTAECLRVLKSGGVLRVVVPDLEGVARLYLQALEAALEGGSTFVYDWAMMELYDQAVRQSRGGEMAKTIACASPVEREFLASRIERSPCPAGDGARLPRLFRDSPAALWARVRRRSSSLRNAATDALIRVTCGRQALRHVRLGRFRMSGEIHLWMYDRFSLGRLLTDAGFVDVVVSHPGESRIPDFERFGLEIVGGYVRQPSSLFVDCVRPPR
jgi:SAM-dependent methyltransferase